MRLDHIAYRVADRYKTAEFFKNAFDYTVSDEFQVEFDDGTTADCVALEPPLRHPVQEMWNVEWVNLHPDTNEEIKTESHAPPEIFVSDGPPGSIVGDWVANRGNVGGVHHMAHECDDVEVKMAEWKEAGYAEFLSEEPMTCPGLIQVFTKPSELTGIIYELINRTGKGFCKDNVKDLMNSTSDLS